MRPNRFKPVFLVLFILPYLFAPPSYIEKNYANPSFLASDEEGLSIILMIGDGMGFEHVNISRLVEKGLNGHLTLEQLEFNCSVMTYSANAEVTDSAASATAIATGFKTNNGMLAMNPSEESLTTILEIANSKGKSTGLVTTTFIQHATPAAFMTHVESRNSYSEISRQIVEEADVDVLLGGGTSYFSSSQLDAMETNDYEIVENRTALLDANSGKLLGLFSGGYMDYERDRDFELTPSLAEMTNKSIEILSQNPDGFFLMVEGGRIDHAGHDNNEVNVALDTIAFDYSVDVALQYVQSHEDTILIVTADHETGGLSVLNSNLNETLPSAAFSEERNRELRIARANNVSVSWSTGSHTDTPVPLYAYGKAFENQTSGYVIDNIDIFDIMNSYYAGEEIILTNYTDLRIDSPSDIEYEAGTTDHILEWKSYASQPHSFIVLLNSSELDSGPWDGSEIIISVDGLDIGVYNYTIFVNDTSGNHVIDVVFVLVVDTIAPIINSPLDIHYIEGQTGHLISWELEDLYPSNYEISMNGTVIRDGAWNSSDETITINVDNLSPALYVFNISIIDTSGNIAFDVVNVVVEPEEITSETTSTTTTSTTEDNQALYTAGIIITALAITTFIVVFVLFIHKRNRL
jgi:alkaline phosphatase